jgi:hypothetical protein
MQALKSGTNAETRSIPPVSAPQDFSNAYGMVPPSKGSRGAYVVPSLVGQSVVILYRPRTRLALGEGRTDDKVVGDKAEAWAEDIVALLYLISQPT